MERVLWRSARPQFLITIYLFHDDNPADGAYSSTSFTIALPTLLPPADGRRLYCRADDAPCLRGGRPYRANGLHNVTNLSAPWSIKADGTPLSVVSSSATDLEEDRRAVARAEVSIVWQWNNRCDRNLFPPWMALSDDANVDRDFALRVGANVLPISGPWQDSSNRDRALYSLESFLADNRKPTKFIVCPESCYGWDLQLLEKKIPMIYSRLGTANATAMPRLPPLSVSYTSTEQHGFASRLVRRRW